MVQIRHLCSGKLPSMVFLFPNPVEKALSNMSESRNTSGIMKLSSALRDSASGLKFSSHSKSYRGHFRTGIGYFSSGFIGNWSQNSRTSVEVSGEGSKHAIITFGIWSGENVFGALRDPATHPTLTLCITYASVCAQLGSP